MSNPYDQRRRSTWDNKISIREREMAREVEKAARRGDDEEEVFAMDGRLDLPEDPLGWKVEVWCVPSSRAQPALPCAYSVA